MHYLIYDSAKYGSYNLMLLRGAFATNAMLLSTRYDNDMEFVAPWIFKYENEQAGVFNQLSITSQNLCWIDTEASLQDIVSIYQKIIYNGDIANAKQFYRCWDVKVAREELHKSSEIAHNLLRVTGSIYLPDGKNFEHYTIDAWGKIVKKLVNSISSIEPICASQQQD